MVVLNTAQFGLLCILLRLWVAFSKKTCGSCACVSQSRLMSHTIYGDGGQGSPDVPYLGMPIKYSIWAY